MTKFEMTKWQSKRVAHGIVAHSGVRHLAPADRRQTDIGPVQVSKKRAVSAGVPAEKI